MAMRPFPPIPTYSSVLVSLSLMIVAAAAEALKEPPPRYPGPASASAPASSQQLCHVSHSYLALACAVIRRKYKRTVHGQLGLVDMVQLIAICSIIQGIRLWRKRSLTQKDRRGTSDAGHAKRKASSRISIRSSKLGKFRWRHAPAIEKCSCKACPRAFRHGVY